ncbi:RibD family protein [Xenophilus azovorans]|uniref:RibD family protein n=1 Tax=Xenophilus azovorans TaxID=151755 RepID=UPI00068B46A9|nr:dihydrofolate reductase family protein [Xenophilus azovorans]
MPADPSPLHASAASAERPAHAQPGSAEALWALLLCQAHGARSASSGEALDWQPDAGWALRGAWADAARALFALFKPLLDIQARTGGWVVGQLGQSLDGCVATRTGESRFINGPENIVHLHRLRALSEVVLLGAGSVAADNPLLTTRKVPGPNPTRVLLDPRAGLAERAASAQVFVDRSAPTLWLCDARWRSQAEEQAGAGRVLAVPGLLRDDDGTPDAARAVAALRSRGLRRIFVEGGGVTVSRFLAQGCLDRLHLSVAPLLVGNGRPGLRFDGPARLADCARPAHRVHPMGVDQLWDLDLRG